MSGANHECEISGSVEWTKWIEEVRRVVDRTCKSPRGGGRGEHILRADCESLSVEAVYEASKTERLTSGLVATIARRKCIDVLRKRKTSSKKAPICTDAGVVLEEIQDSTTSAEWTNVERWLATLTTESRRIVEMSIFEEKSQAVIARELGLTKGAVGNRKRQALAKLAELKDIIQAKQDNECVL